MGFKTGFTGTRKGMTPRQHRELKFLLWARIAISLKREDLPPEFHHGGCKGSDREAEDIARKFGYIIHVHPAKEQWGQWISDPKNDILYPCKPYLERNRDIVNAVDHLFATPDGAERLRSGTWATVRYARVELKSYTIIYP